MSKHIQEEIPEEPVLLEEETVIEERMIEPEIYNHKSYRVLVGDFNDKEDAKFLLRDLNYKGFGVSVVKEEGRYKIQCGEFSVRQHALNLKYRLELRGHKPIIL